MSADRVRLSEPAALQASPPSAGAKGEKGGQGASGAGAGSPPGGGLRIEAFWDGERVRRAVVRSTRPAAASLLLGRSAEEALRLVPALFSLCGRAQAAAAVAALAAAGAPGVAVGEPAAVERALTAEMAQEHLWRLMLDWPALFGHTPRREPFAALHRHLGRVADAGEAFALGGELLDRVVAELLCGFFDGMREPRGVAELGARARRGGSLGAVLAELVELVEIEISPAAGRTVPLLPPMTAATWAGRLGTVPRPAFQAAPVLAGSPHETGALARHADSPLVRALLGHQRRLAARLLARAVDLADCASRLRHPLAAGVPALVDAAALGEGGGLACVETARGLLMHAVRLEGGQIAEYAIVAPTEWNFHPDGPFVREAGALRADSREAARRRLEALTLALDPCVPCEIVLEETAHA